jgi:hypothetical protein
MVAFVASTVLTAAALNSAFNALTVRTTTGTSDTLVLADNGGMVTYSNVPPFASVAYATGTIIRALNLGAGAVTLTAGAGVTILGTAALAQNESSLLVKTATNTWVSLTGGSGGGGSVADVLMLGGM